MGLRLKRLALIPLGVILALALLEGGLQIAAVWVKSGSGLPIAERNRELRVLCAGDSNTYGLYLDRDDSYPAQLEAIWAERVQTPTLEVLNLGYPGTNSSRLVRDFPDLLARARPDLVILMVGVNDYWTAPVPLAEGGRGPSLGTLLRQHSKVYRAYLLARRGLEGELAFERDERRVPEGPHRIELGGQTFDAGFERVRKGKPGVSGRLLANLVSLVDLTRRGGAGVLLMSYPARHSFYPRANRTITQAAVDAGAPVVDLTAIFRERCAAPGCPELLFEDGHPRASGARVIAETLVEELSARYGR